MNSNDDEKMYKKKYLKYKMKYLSLQRGGNFFTLSKLKEGEMKQICGDATDCNKRRKEIKCPRSHLGINVKNRKECVEKLIQEEKDYVLKTVKTNGLYLKDAPPVLQKDKEIQAAAFENNMFALEGINNKNTYIGMIEYPDPYNKKKKKLYIL